MQRNTEQYAWNIVFTALFILFLGLSMIVVTNNGSLSVFRLTVFDIAIIALASQRVVRLFVYDNVMKWFREQFYDSRTTKDGTVTLHTPKRGPRRTIVDLLSCPWCFGLWATSVVAFFYIMTPYAYYPALVLALSTVVSTLQITVNWIGHNAEAAKQRNERN